MAATGIYKLDDGNSFVSNCFPARNLYRPVIEGVDQWVRPRRAPKEQKFKTAVVSKSLEKQDSANSRLNDNTPAQSQKIDTPLMKEQEAEGNVLNAEFLLKSHYVDNPSDLCSVNVSDKNVTSVEEEEFEQFDSVAYINAAENLLTLAQFRKFSALRELELSMNGIRNLEVNAGDFPHLEILDLSYNNLSTNDVLTLGLLPRLRVLHLTANGLTHLPSDMAISERENAELKRFPFLEILMLDDNKLSHPSVFASLANLKRLKQLHLENNGICEIPYLHQLEDGLHTSSPTWVRVLTNREDSCHSHSALHSPTTSKQKRVPDAPEDLPTGGEQINYVVLPSKEDPDRTEVVFTGMPKLPLDSSLRKPPDMGKSYSFPHDFKTMHQNSCKKPSPTFEPPLPELRYLSLADNKIECEENLLAVALFPSLAELVIHSNPLTTLRKGDPPLLTSFLKNRLGITLIRRKPPELGKPHIYIPVKAKRKVKTRIPKIPKQPLMLGAPPVSSLWGLEFNFNWNEHMDSGKQPSSPYLSPDPLPPIKSSPVEEKALDGDMQQEPSVTSDCTPQASTTDQDLEREDFDSVFMTQVEDLTVSPCESEEEEHRTTEHEAPEKEKSNVQIPEIFRGYEELYFVKPDPDFIEPVGISDNVKALEHALKHMLVHREAKPRLHSLQKPYVSREKKIGKVISGSPRKSKGETLEDILSSMKTAKTYTELPLGLILRNKKFDRKEYGEALTLLKEIQFRYHRAHKESSERAREIETSVYK